MQRTQFGFLIHARAVRRVRLTMGDLDQGAGTRTQMQFEGNVGEYTVETFA